MFCGNCGKEIEDTSEFCPYCGATVEKEALAANDSKYAKIFVEPNENYIDSLGNNYINSFLTDKKIDCCIAFLSDKRVYLRGDMININGGKLEHSNIQQTIDLEDITGTGFVYSSPQVWKLVLAIILPIIGILLLFLHNAGGVLGVIASILLLVSYMKGRNTLFFIEYAGGCIKFDASIYGLAESRDFEKQIRRAKNKVKENK